MKRGNRTVLLIIAVFLSMTFITQSTCQEPINTLSTPQPNSQSLHVSVDGKNVTLAITGNISAAQISDMFFDTREDWYNNTDIAFTVTGLNGSAGFMNMTIPKNSILGGTEPTVAANGAQAENEGFAQDGDNFYVWFTMLPQWDNSNRGYVAIHFLLVNNHEPIKPSTGFDIPGLDISIGVVVVFIVAALILLIIRYRRRQIRQR